VLSYVGGRPRWGRWQQTPRNHHDSGRRGDPETILLAAERDLLARGCDQARAGGGDFSLAGLVRALLNLFEGHFVSTMKAMRHALDLAQSEIVGPVALELRRTDLESHDFSRDVLERHEQMLQELRVPSCGCTDLGTPKRVEGTIRILARVRSPATTMHSATGAHYLELATSQRQMRLPQAS
jgi:hypothetical protein